MEEAVRRYLAALDADREAQKEYQRLASTVSFWLDGATISEGEKAFSQATVRVAETGKALRRAEKGLRRVVGRMEKGTAHR